MRASSVCPKKQAFLDQTAQGVSCQYNGEADQRAGSVQLAFLTDPGRAAVEPQVASNISLLVQQAADKDATNQPRQAERFFIEACSASSPADSTSLRNLPFALSTCCKTAQVSGKRHCNREPTENFWQAEIFGLHKERAAALRRLRKPIAEGSNDLAAGQALLHVSRKQPGRNVVGFDSPHRTRSRRETPGRVDEDSKTRAVVTYKYQSEKRQAKRENTVKVHVTNSGLPGCRRRMRMTHRLWSHRVADQCAAPALCLNFPQEKQKAL